MTTRKPLNEMTNRELEAAARRAFRANADSVEINAVYEELVRRGYPPLRAAELLHQP